MIKNMSQENKCITCNVPFDERDDWETLVPESNLLLCPDCLIKTSMFIKFNEGLSNQTVQIERMSVELERLRKIESAINIIIEEVSKQSLAGGL